MDDTTTQTMVATKQYLNPSERIVISTTKYPNLKKLFDEKIEECNDREVGRNISYADLLNYFLNEMDGDDIEAVQEECLTSKEMFEIEFREQFKRPSKGNELFAWARRKYE